MPAFEKQLDLAYGENPHQRAAYYARARRPHAPARARRAAARAGALVQQPERPERGRACSLREFTLPACVIVKHANPCGVAVGASIEEAYERALAADPLSAFGGVVVLNRPGLRRARRAARGAVRRGAPRARLRRGGAGGARAQAGDADPRRPRAARAGAVASATTGACSAGCSCRSATGTSPTARGWRSSPGSRPRRPGATSSSPGASASTSPRTRSCSRRTCRRSGSAPAR